MKLLPILLAITTVLGLGGSAYFFTAKRSVSSEKVAVEQQLFSAEQNVDRLEDEKEQLEKDLIFYKNTDLAKEVELLQLKLETAEEELAASKSEVSRLTTRNTTLEDNAKKIKSYVKAVDLLQEGFFGSGRLEDKFPEIGKAVAAIGDKGVSEKWQAVEQTVRADLVDGSWSPAPLGEMTDLLMNRLRTFLP